MSFEKINNIDTKDIHNRKCIMIINFKAKELIALRNLISMLGIKDQIILNNKNGNSIVKDILDNKKDDISEAKMENKALIFNNIPNNKVSAVLDGLKKVKINRPLSALVTETSINWTLSNLIKNLEEEKIAMKNGNILNHNKK